MDRKTRSAALAAALAMVLIGGSGCGSLRMTREAERVVVTDRAPEAESCKPRGVVFALAPFSSPREPVEQLKIRASQIGADTVVLNREKNAPNGDWSGKAYRCGNSMLGAAELDAERRPD